MNHWISSAIGLALVLLMGAPDSAPKSALPEAIEHPKPIASLVGDWVSNSPLSDGKVVHRTISYKWLYEGVCFQTKAVETPATVIQPGPAKSTWGAFQAAREEVLRRYCETASSGYDWFAHAMHGEQAGTPFLLFRMLPELDPVTWGSPEERLARFGFFDDPRDRTRPLPLGLGWVEDPVRGDRATHDYHTVTLTCAACHVGRVRVVEDKLLVGAPNTQIDVRKFRSAMEQSTQRILADQALPETVKRMADLIRAKPTGYFFGGRYGIDARMEEEERARFLDADYSAKVLRAFAARVRGGRAAVLKQLQTNYSKPNAPPLDGGTPGQSDGSGDLIPKLLLFRELTSSTPGDPIARFLATSYPELPDRNATTTDNLSVWNQWDRPFGQLDASIKSPIIRNVAAETAVVGSAVRRDAGGHLVSAVNVKNADICGRFTAWLPSPPYPFEVDMERARRGESLFRQHCATCHRAGNGEVYGAEKIGTDMNRARVLTQQGKQILLNNFKAAIPFDYEATSAVGDTYRPALLSDEEIINDRVRADRQGYAAGPLDGIWARAPFLHNGSVPTLRHLLAPLKPESRRPEEFIRGSVRYDVLNVGFLWDLREMEAIKADSPSAARFDTRWDGASSQGHDRDITLDGRLHRLDWSGQEHASELEDLLEYLKTL